MTSLLVRRSCEDTGIPGYTETEAEAMGAQLPEAGRGLEETLPQSLWEERSLDLELLASRREAPGLRCCVTGVTAALGT